MREDGGTPGFLQCIKTALAIKLKDAMGVENIQQREAEITRYVMVNLAKNKQVMMLDLTLVIVWLLFRFMSRARIII
ncbi:MAG: selenocysteine lyase/cysteine desulfurase [Cognaticolwellia sp.]|jgi:selenocysteine lyase/cysteine desulfurase